MVAPGTEDTKTDKSSQFPFFRDLLKSSGHGELVEQSLEWIQWTVWYVSSAGRCVMILGNTVDWSLWDTRGHTNKKREEA